MVIRQGISMSLTFHEPFPGADPIAVIIGKSKGIVYLAPPEFDDDTLMPIVDGDHMNDGFCLRDRKSKIVPAVPKFDPAEKQRTVIYLAAPPGAGKTFWLRDYIRQFNKSMTRKPTRDLPHGFKPIVWLVSSKEVCDTLDPLVDEGIDLRRLDVDNIIDSPISIKEELSQLDEDTGDVGPTLCIFDDIDTGFANKKIQQAVVRLQDQVVMNGRSLGLFVAITAHVATQYRDTRNLLSNITHLVIFARHAPPNSYEYILRKYVNLPQKIITKITKIGVRWVMIAVQGVYGQRYYLSERCIKIIPE